eukprot:scaffold11019_cov75-Phaeocystis_antarctica.AAC.10
MAATIAATGSNDTATAISSDITLKQITLPQPSCRTALLGSGPNTLGREAFWTVTASLPTDAAIIDWGQVIAACGAKGVQNDSMIRVRAMKAERASPRALRRPRCELEVGVSASMDPGKMLHQAEAGQLGPHVEAGREREHGGQPQRHTSVDSCWSAWEVSVRSAALSPARQTKWSGRCCKPPRKADSDARALLACACQPATT